MSENNLPSRVRVLILGGGIHGVGALHDLSSRGWKDIMLIEKSEIGSGTSSRSTKLIHGGLRYLKRISQFGMVAESLKERKLLIELAGDLVKPIEFYYPILKEGGSSSLKIKAGLFLYDLLAGKYKLAAHKNIDLETVKNDIPNIDVSKISRVYSFWDGQTDDLALVKRVASSAVKLGAKVEQGLEALSIKPSQDGWNVEVKTADGSIKTISTLYVLNCLGPWAHKIIENSGLNPTHHAVNNKGVHLILKNPGLKKGLFLESPADGRIFFLLPWLDHILLGTTEGRYDGDPDKLQVSEEEVDYLLERANRYLTKPFTHNDISAKFAGLRWLAVDPGKSLTSTSRESVIGEMNSKRGLLLTVYGGKLTSYRSLCQKLGDRVTEHFGEFRPSATGDKANWAVASECYFSVPEVLERFPVVR